MNFKARKKEQLNLKNHPRHTTLHFARNRWNTAHWVILNIHGCEITRKMK